MENSRETLVNETVSIAENYDSFYQKVGAVGLSSVSLVAHHDPTLRFTNSSTSVMKPRLLEDPEDIAYITQPSTGSQGVDFWRESGVVSSYPSYFLSLGSIYPAQDENAVFDHGNEILNNIWQVPGVEAQIHETDDFKADLLNRLDIPVDRKAGDLDSFRHTYGLDQIYGVNLNFIVRDNKNRPLSLGTLTKIENMHNKFHVWEIAFDLPQVLAAINEYNHVAETMPVFSEINQLSNQSDTTPVAVDAVTTSSAMMLENLVPRSRGKEGIFRKFFAEYVELMKLYGADEVDQQEILTNAFNSEITIRKRLGISVPSLSTQKEIITNSEQWIDRFNN